MKVVEKARILISENKTKDALEMLSKYFTDKDLEIQSECLLNSAKLKKISKDFRLGLVDYTNYLQVLNQINFALLTLLKNIEKPDISSNNVNLKLGEKTADLSTANNNNFDVFLSYSQKDMELVKRLDTQFAVLKESRNIQTWYDQNLLAGQNWLEEIEKAIRRANIIIFLASPDFLASDFCKLELEWAIEKQKSDKTIIIPVILKPCLWRETHLSRFQSLPSNGKAVILWENLDEAFVNIVEGVRDVILDNLNE